MLSITCGKCKYVVGQADEGGYLRVVTNTNFPPADLLVMVAQIKCDNCRSRVKFNGLKLKRQWKSKRP